MVAGWIIILLPTLLGLLGIRSAVRNRSIFKKIVGIAFFGICLLTSVFLLMLLDSLSAVNDRGRFLACRRNLQNIGVAIIQYKNNHQRFPASLETLKLEQLEQLDRFFICCPGIERDGPSIPYTYRIPTRIHGREIIVWDSKPHYIRHRYLRFRNRKLRNILRLDGTVETVSEYIFHQLIDPKNSHQNPGDTTLDCSASLKRHKAMSIEE